MKKFLIFFLMASFLSLGLSVPATSAESSIDPGFVIKGKGNSTVYYVGEDGKRYVFPNDKIYFSWYDDFSEIHEISLDDLQEMPLGGNVQYKPGALLVKIQTDPKVYAVSNNGNLRWVKTESIAKALYGDNWNKLVDDVPDSFFTNYTVGTAIESEGDFDPAEESDAYATFSHSKGWKERLAKMETRYAEKRCDHLERAVNQLQKRLARWGMEMPDLGDDFLNTCIDKVKGNKYGVDKIAICHIPDDGGAPHTINVAKPAARAHLDHGDYLGECTDSTVDEPVDETAPVISAISVNAEGTYATVAWTTDEDSNSMVEYSIEENVASSTEKKSVSSSTMTKSHSLDISNLSISTTYYYVVSSVDAAGNKAIATEGSFTTLAVDPDTTAPVISNIQFEASTTSAIVTWETDELATSKIVYDDVILASSTDPHSLSNDDLKTLHSLTLLDLTASTTYYFKVESKDGSENNAVSAESSFETL